jgi:hypothetical protein
LRLQSETEIGMVETLGPPCPILTAIGEFIKTLAEIVAKCGSEWILVDLQVGPSAQRAVGQGRGAELVQLNREPADRVPIHPTSRHYE